MKNLKFSLYFVGILVLLPISFAVAYLGIGLFVFFLMVTYPESSFAVFGGSELGGNIISYSDLGISLFLSVSLFYFLLMFGKKKFK